MQIGPRYKRARYLGAPVFKKTQTQKFAMRSQEKGKKKGPGRGGKSEYGRQMLEKQKARYSYGISSGRFGNYARAALQAKGDNTRNLMKALESRLDNVVLRAGFASSRSGARQMVNHGHILVNGKGVNIPSYTVSVGDVLTIREGSKKKGIFAKLDEELKNVATPAWLKVNPETKTITVDGEPMADMTGLLFDVRMVLEFYTR